MKKNNDFQILEILIVLTEILFAPLIRFLFISIIRLIKFLIGLVRN